MRPKSRWQISLILLVALTLQTHAETPRQFAGRFYRGCFRWQIRGIPTVEESNRISPFFSTEILRLYTAVNRQRREIQQRSPFDPKHPELAVKPPWSKEGDPFSDTWEGISTFAIGRVTSLRGRVAVPVHLEWIGPGGQSTPWTDVLILDRAGDDWVVSDIRFASGDTLVTTMRQDLRKTARELGHPPK